MKYRHIIALSIILVIGSVCAYADEECSQSFEEAKSLYNVGKYQAAKEMFEYVQQLCGSTYGSANTWVQKCNEAMKGGTKPAASSRPQQQPSSPTTSTTTLSASKTQINASEGSSSEFISITSNKSWYIYSPPASWCQVTQNNSGITLSISPNTNTYRRSTYLTITSNDNKKSVTINVDQAAKTQTTIPTSSSNSSANSSSATLSLSKTYITASAAGTSDCITVTSNRNWEIEYPSGTMYSVEKLSNTLIQVIIKRNTGGSRQDFFNIKTTDGSKTVKVSLSQGQGNSSSSSSNYSSSYSSSSYRTNSNYRSSSSGYTALRSFNSYQGKWEVDWFSMRLNMCTGAEFEASAFGVRYSVLKIEPLIFGWKYNFVNDYSGFYYQPDVKLVFPWNSYCAVEFGAGPSVNFSSSRYGYGPSVWFTTEFGILYHWGNVCSSDFFMRYDGMFVFGVSINFSTGFN